HVDQIRTPGVDITAGSLGQGLSCAAGIAMAGRLDKKDYHVFAVIGDGESNEGQIWESAMFAGHHKLDNLIAICDYNKFQIDGRTDEIVSLEPLADKWRAFGWELFEIDGHDFDSIYDTLQKAKSVKGRPSMIIAHTVKAKGHPIFENQAASHNIQCPDEATHKKYLDALEYKTELPY
ncbi:MAG: transketolase, partial [Oligoflexales bacterium]|nr:transketolase [Oligoflexales bacterium]